MSAQQYQYAKSYYQDPYQYQQYMNGSAGQAQGLTQLQQSQGQSQQGQPLGAQSLLLANQYQQPMSLYYMMGNQQVPSQIHLQGQQPQQQQYQPYQQPQQPQQLLHQQGGPTSGDYSHYASYSGTSAPYNQYAVYQQSQQPTAQNQMYGVPAGASTGLSGQQAPSTASSATTNPTTQTAQQGSLSATSGVATVPPASAKASSPAESGANANVGQLQPPGIRPRVTTTMWEDEKTLCYQVDANNVSVVRRADNNMINGTKLLNVAQMTRGRRDGILKLEKVRHVVKIGSMHLKGVWIPFERALAMAQREGIVDLLYPLFVRDIKRVIQTGVTPAAQTAAAGTTATAPPSTTAKSTPLVPQQNGSYSASSAGGAAAANGSGTAAASSNPSTGGYYPQYQAGYPLTANSGTSGNVLGESGSASQQQTQQVGQQQMYPYSQPYFNQYYPYGQGGGATGASLSYGSYSAPMYSSSYPYGQQPQGIPYQGQPQQPQLAQSQQAPQPQQSSPLVDKKPDMKPELKK